MNLKKAEPQNTEPTKRLRKGKQFTFNTWRWIILKKAGMAYEEQMFLCKCLTVSDMPDTKFSETAIRQLI